MEESAKPALEKRAHTEPQVARLAKTAEDALRRLNDSSRRVELLEEEARILKLQFIKIVTAHDSAVAKSKNRQMKVNALEACMPRLGDELDSLKR